MRIKSSNKIKLDSILSAQNVKCKVTKGRQILSGHPNLTFATTLLALSIQKSRPDSLHLEEAANQSTALNRKHHRNFGRLSKMTLRVSNKEKLQTCH